jgi:hypothetical protein
MRAGGSIPELRDRAILKFYLATGARIATGCKLSVFDLRQDVQDAKRDRIAKDTV